MSAWYVGLDLGQVSDYTAIAVAEQRPEVADTRLIRRYDLRHLERVRGKSYQAVGEQVKALMGTPALAGARLIVDKTGVGAAVVDQIRAVGLEPIAVTIHGGDVVTGEGLDWRVPKRELVGTVQVLLQNGYLRIAQALPLAHTLTAELLNFKVTIDPATAHDSYAAWREADHDDLVLAVALACWYSEHQNWPAQRRDQELLDAYDRAGR